MRGVDTTADLFRVLTVDVPVWREGGAQTYSDMLYIHVKRFGPSQLSCLGSSVVE